MCRHLRICISYCEHERACARSRSTHLRQTCAILMPVYVCGVFFFSFSFFQQAWPHGGGDFGGGVWEGL